MADTLKATGKGSSFWTNWTKFWQSKEGQEIHNLAPVAVVPAIVSSFQIAAKSSKLISAQIAANLNKLIPAKVAGSARFSISPVLRKAFVREIFTHGLIGGALLGAAMGGVAYLANSDPKKSFGRHLATGGTLGAISGMAAVVTIFPLYFAASLKMRSWFKTALASMLFSGTAVGTITGLIANRAVNTIATEKEDPSPPKTTSISKAPVQNKKYYGVNAEVFEFLKKIGTIRGEVYYVETDGDPYSFDPSKELFLDKKGKNPVTDSATRKNVGIPYDDVQEVAHAYLQVESGKCGFEACSREEMLKSVQLLLDEISEFDFPFSTNISASQEVLVKAAEREPYGVEIAEMGIEQLYSTSRENRSHPEFVRRVAPVIMKSGYVNVIQRNCFAVNYAYLKDEKWKKRLPEYVALLKLLPSESDRAVFYQAYEKATSPSEKADKIVLALVTAFPKNAYFQHRFAVSCDTWGATYEADLKAVALEPDNAEYQMALGLSSGEMEKADESRKAYLKALHLVDVKRDEELFGTIKKALVAIGEEALKTKTAESLSVALECFAALAAKMPGHADYSRNAGKAAFAMKKYGEAKKYFEQAVKTETVPTERAIHLYNLGIALQALGENEKALLAYKEAVKDDPKLKPALAVIKKLESIVAAARANTDEAPATPAEPAVSTPEESISLVSEEPAVSVAPPPAEVITPAKSEAPAKPADKPAKPIVLRTAPKPAPKKAPAPPKVTGGFDDL